MDVSKCCCPVHRVPWDSAACIRMAAAELANLKVLVCLIGITTFHYWVTGRIVGKGNK
jgi:hypothetical protein